MCWMSAINKRKQEYVHTSIYQKREKKMKSWKRGEAEKSAGKGVGK